MTVTSLATHARRYDQCDNTCTVDCGHCKGAGRPSLRYWWDGQAPAVRAVIDLAWLRDDATPEAHDRILALVAPSHANAIASISEDLAAAEEYDAGQRDHLVGEDWAEREAERLRADVLTNAQLVASLLERGVR